MNRPLIFILLSLIILSFTQTPISPVKYQAGQYEVSCAGTGKEGTQFIKVFSYHKKPKKAIEYCKKNAVHALLFQGIQQGSGGCARNPLIPKTTELSQHDAYFTQLMEKDYHQYIITTTDQNPEMWKLENNKYKLAISVQVNYAALRAKLEADNIIKKLDHGF